MKKSRAFFLFILLISLITISRVEKAFCEDDGFIEILPDDLVRAKEQQREYIRNLPDAGARLQHTIGIEAVRWEPGSTIKVCFFKGYPELLANIARVAVEWSQHANIHFDFGSLDAPRLCPSRELYKYGIRIDFEPKAFYSLIGRESETLVPGNRESMVLGNYGFAGVDPANPDFRHRVLHEFGHALGLLHEHQRPDLHCDDEIDWNEAYKHYGQVGWPKEQVERNIKQISLYSREGTLVDAANRPVSLTGPDKTSVMMYSLPLKILKSGKLSSCYAPEASVLSGLDKELIQRMYPANVTAELRSIWDLNNVRFLETFSLSSSLREDRKVERYFEHVKRLGKRF